MRTFSDESRAIGCLTFSPDGRLLAMGSHDHGIELWDVVTMCGWPSGVGAGSTQPAYASLPMAAPWPPPATTERRASGTCRPANTSGG